MNIVNLANDVRAETKVQGSRDEEDQRKKIAPRRELDQWMTNGTNFPVVLAKTKRSRNARTASTGTIENAGLNVIVGLFECP